MRGPRRLLPALVLLVACGGAPATAPDQTPASDAATTAATGPPPSTSTSTSAAGASAGVSDEDDEERYGAYGPATTSADEGEDADVTIEGFAFQVEGPVAAGEPVVVVNLDSASHTWTSDGGEFDSGTIASGARTEVVVDEPGTYDFHCEIHPSMTGTLEVEPG